MPALTGWELIGQYAARTFDVRQANAEAGTAAGTEAEQELYYISGDTFWHATGTINVKPYRAIFRAINNAFTSSRFGIFDGDDTNSLDQLITQHPDGTITLDLQGRPTTRHQQGLLISNGRIIFQR